MQSPPPRLLMIDDEQGDISLFQALFQDVAPDFQFQAALSGEQAMALLSTSVGSLPDLILLDVNMPGMDGHAVLAAIKTDPALRHLTVVMLSKSIQQEDIQRAYHGLASAYLEKPTGLNDGLEVVRAFQGFWRLARLPHA